MSLAAAPVRPLTIEEWYELYHDDEGGRCELVRGRAIVTPPEDPEHARMIGDLSFLLHPAFASSWRTLWGVGLLLRGDPDATFRSPDVSVLSRDIDMRGWYVHPHQVALAVEITSWQSVETDWVHKRAEYAAAGIPNYLIVDVRFDDGPRLWLFDQLVPNAGGGPTTYADTTGDGHSATLRLPGCDPITITAADLA